MKEIYHCLWINVKQKDVLRAITEKDGLSGWWTRNLDGEGSIGSLSTFRFSSGAFNRMKILNIKSDKVEWECVDGHQEWIGTCIRFELRGEGSSTKVCFSHYNFAEQTEYVGECSFHWAYYLQSLQQFCETGKGTPDPGA